jgi:septum formation topological specificity factor MinE
VGLFDLFRRRRVRESALPPSASVERPTASVEPASASVTPPSASPGTDQPVVGQQISGLGGAGFDLGTMLGGGIQINQSPQSIDMSGVEGLREEIMQIMRNHGIDPETGATGSVDASAMPQMQQEILQTLSRHGLDFGAGSAQVDPD